MRRSGGGLQLQTALAVFVVLAAMLTCAVCRNPVRYLVGGNDNRWKPNVNYTNWSLQQVFYVGDWLCVFSKFCRKRLNVHRLTTLFIDGKFNLNNLSFLNLADNNPNLVIGR
ncbi:putative phytocyanin [Helianthus annuus]|uniref:Phytocyanin n=1 Tax=Helianthus annuus TaxID=4232 RepID=A0A9K3E381_HELAN|nr:putative phytocyanin [Helianthus annuus]KAJ0452507.1 putative phytocyanin [Helianthus annuus]KAJ0474408.1 putative phytocyanin [Helianthus annuus]KAJ0649972.1 putative phytocyanin [Helianthus annuus]KAJ0846288.1 putative phytocyanin [Helianthus annuus]